MSNKKRFLSLLLTMAIMISAVSFGPAIESGASGGWIDAVRDVSLNTNVGRYLPDVDNYTYGYNPNSPYNESWFQIFRVKTTKATTLYSTLQSTEDIRDSFTISIADADGENRTLSASLDFDTKLGIYSYQTHMDVTPGQYLITVTPKSGSLSVTTINSRVSLSSKLPKSACSLVFEARSASQSVIDNLSKTKVSLSSKSVTIEQGKSKTITATATPYRKITWTTTNADVATVSATGKITATGVGTATITAWSSDQMATASCKVKVIKPVIIKKVKSSKPVVSKHTAAKTSIKLTLKSSSIVKGAKYQIQYRRKGTSKWSLISKDKATALTVSALRKNTTYQLRVREWAKVNGVYYYGKWSKTETIKTRK